jgi:hypothetical protein
MKNTLYPQANATQALVLVDRNNFGVSDLSQVRYVLKYVEHLFVEVLHQTFGLNLLWLVILLFQLSILIFALLAIVRVT